MSGTVNGGAASQAREIRALARHRYQFGHRYQFEAPANAAGASSCRVSQGGWEGRDTKKNLGSESCQTRMVRDLKFGAATPPDRGSLAPGSAAGLRHGPCGMDPAARTKALNGESHGSNGSREGQDPSSPRGWPADRRRHCAGAPRTARSGGQAGHRDHDGGQQTANSLSPRPRTHGLTPAGPVPRATRKEKPRRSGA
jgi:hypothetical protein